MLHILAVQTSHHLAVQENKDAIHNMHVEYPRLRCQPVTTGISTTISQNLLCNIPKTRVGF